MTFTMQQFQLRLQALDKGIVSRNEIYNLVVSPDDGKITWPGVSFSDYHDVMDRRLVQEQLVLQLYDKTILTSQQVREFLGYKPTEEDA